MLRGYIFHMKDRREVALEEQRELLKAIRARDSVRAEHLAPLVVRGAVRSALRRSVHGGRKRRQSGLSSGTKYLTVPRKAVVRAECHTGGLPTYRPVSALLDLTMLAASSYIGYWILDIVLIKFNNG